MQLIVMNVMTKRFLPNWYPSIAALIGWLLSVEVDVEVTIWQRDLWMKQVSDSTKSIFQPLVLPVRLKLAPAYRLHVVAWELKTKPWFSYFLWVFLLKFRCQYLFRPQTSRSGLLISILVFPRRMVKGKNAQHLVSTWLHTNMARDRLSPAWTVVPLYLLIKCQWQ